MLLILADKLCAFIWDKIILWWAFIYFIFFIWKKTFHPVKIYEVKKNEGGYNPFETAFNSFLSSIGIGSVFSPMLAVQIGGAGAIVWMFFGFIVTAAIKYSEVFLSIKYRIKKNGLWTGGIFHVLFSKPAYRLLFYPFLVLFLLGAADPVQCNIVWNNISHLIPAHLIIKNILLVAMIFGVLNMDLRKIFKLGRVILFFLFIGYIYLFTYCIGHSHINIINFVYNDFILSFRTGIWLKQMFYGITTAIYAGGIGLGGDSLIECESNASNPYKQATISSLGLICPLIVCVMSATIFLCLPVGLNINTKIHAYIPYSSYIFPIICILCGLMSIMFCLNLGVRAFSIYVSKKKWAINGLKVIYACMLFIFSFIQTQFANTIILLILGLLFLITLFVISKELKDGNL